MIKDRITEATNSGAAGMKNAADALAKAGNEAGAKGEELYTAGAGYLREHPVVTIGVAMATGYLLSRLLAKR